MHARPSDSWVSCLSALTCMLLSTTYWLRVDWLMSKHKPFVSNWFSEEGPGRVRSQPSPPLAVPNVTAHPSTASVLITVLLYNDPLICGFNMLIKGLNQHCSFNSTGWLIKTSPIFCLRKDSYSKPSSKPRVIGHCLHFAYLSCQWRHPRRHWEILDRHTCIINLSLLLVSEWL